MSQTRIHDFGSLLTQKRSKKFAKGVFSPGVYSGFDVEVESDTLLSITPGSVVFPHGVLVVEDEPTPIVFSTPSLPTTYSLLAHHSDVQAIGGSDASYLLVEGERAPHGDPDEKSLVIAYIRHPGVVPISSGMIYTPPKLAPVSLLSHSSTPTTLFAPFPTRYNNIQGANIKVTASSHAGASQVLGARVENTAGVGSQQLAFDLPLLTEDRLPSTIEVYADLPALCSIALEVYDASNNLVPTTNPLTAGPVTGLTTSPAALLTLDTTSADFLDPGRPYRLHFVLTVAAGAEMFLSRVVINHDHFYF